MKAVMVGAAVLLLKHHGLRLHFIYCRKEEGLRVTELSPCRATGVLCSSLQIEQPSML